MRGKKFFGSHFGFTCGTLTTVGVDGGEEALIAEGFGAFGTHSGLQARVVAEKVVEIVGYTEIILARLHY